MCWFSHRCRTGGRHNFITYLLTDVVAWPTATPATPTSVCWFLCSDSAHRHILGCGDPRMGPVTPKFELGRDFCAMHLTTKFHRPTFNRCAWTCALWLISRNTNPSQTSASISVVVCSTRPDLVAIYMDCLCRFMLRNYGCYNWRVGLVKNCANLVYKHQNTFSVNVKYSRIAWDIDTFSILKKD